MEHELKTLPKYYDAVARGDKTFEVRKDDRNYKKGDTLILREHENGEYTNYSQTCTITYILGRNEDEKMFVAEGFVILGIK